VGDDEGLQNGSQAEPEVHCGPPGGSRPDGGGGGHAYATDSEGVEMSMESDCDGPEIWEL